MATYVIGDIHGQLEQLKVLLEKMKFNENDELYVMGDVVDRGPDPIKALQYLMTLPNCVCIAGNHEWMALESLKLMLNEITEEFIQTLDENQVTILLDFAMEEKRRWINFVNCRRKSGRKCFIL